jgi:CRP/FNR family transcriptional regulator, cyclic AMP receptor protein
MLVAATSVGEALRLITAADFRVLFCDLHVSPERKGSARRAYVGSVRLVGTLLRKPFSTLLSYFGEIMARLLSRDRCSELRTAQRLGGLDDLRVSHVSRTLFVATFKKRSEFDPQTFLATIDAGRTIAAFPKKQAIFVQGDLADAVFYIQRGRVRLAVVSKGGKEATIGILNEGDFFGEDCLGGQPLRLSSANAMTNCTVMRIDKRSMMQVIHGERAFSDMFVAYLLARNIRYEEELLSQLFNSSEKRLARALLLLAHFGKDGKQEAVIPKMRQETLAEMIGTTRSRVSFFMNRFRRLGLIDYQAGEALRVHSSLLNIVLHD